MAKDIYGISREYVKGLDKDTLYLITTRRNNYSIYNGKIAINRVTNQAYNFANCKAKMSDVRKDIEGSYNSKITKVTKDSKHYHMFNVENI